MTIIFLLPRLDLCGGDTTTLDLSDHQEDVLEQRVLDALLHALDAGLSGCVLVFVLNFEPAAELGMNVFSPARVPMYSLRRFTGTLRGG